MIAQLLQAGVDHADGAVGHAFGGVEARRARCDLSLDEAKLGDRFAEGLALLCVANHVRQGVARTAHAGHAQLEAAHVEHVEGDVVALARLAQQVRRGHFAVLQHQRAGG